MGLQYTMFDLPDEKSKLLMLARSLGATKVGNWSESEQTLLVDKLSKEDPNSQNAQDKILAGLDPLGDKFTSILSTTERRPLGATYTPEIIVDSMIRWASTLGKPDRIIDPGCGSARFLVAGARAFPNAELVGLDIDPYAAILARGHIAAAGFADRATILCSDYRSALIPPINGRTLYIGNPPYVRHHHIDPLWKKWLVDSCKKLGFNASQLSGLHVHFLVATAIHANKGDWISFITSAEWLDVNYGQLPRNLFLDALGGTGIHIVEPSADPFPGTQSTAVITTYEVGTSTPFVNLQRVSETNDLGNLTTTRTVSRDKLLSSNRWTTLSRTYQQKREGFVELGELCRVHRGQVTGANRVWISGDHSKYLPASVLFPAITKARELIAACDVLKDLDSLRKVIDIPIDLDQLTSDERKEVDRFLVYAHAEGADSSYIARNRKAWWSVGLRTPAPILATYMARRAPAFIVNKARARHINVAHGIYPRENMSEAALSSLADFLTRNTDVAEGRTYAGGLTKFEPKEMERILVPASSDYH